MTQGGIEARLKSKDNQHHSNCTFIFSKALLVDYINQLFLRLIIRMNKQHSLHNERNGMTHIITDTQITSQTFFLCDMMIVDCPWRTRLNMTFFFLHLCVWRCIFFKNLRIFRDGEK